MMKIFISHSSKNVKYGQAIVDLLVAVGVNSEQIIFTSNDAFGIPTGQNIFNWLKARITEKPHVIYLLSSEYYSSIAPALQSLPYETLCKCLQTLRFFLLLRNSTADKSLPTFYG